MLNFLPGKKTYIIGVAAILWGVASSLLGDLGPLPVADDPVRVMGEGLALLTLRKGIEGA